MSICLNVIGEHNFNIAQKTKEENAEQIIERLRNIEGLNEGFIYDQNNYSNDLIFVDWKNRESWSVYFMEYENEPLIIEIEGPYGITFQFYKHIVEYSIDSPSFNYWMNKKDYFGRPEHLVRNEYRKLYCQFQKAFGGNRVIYFSDSGLAQETVFQLDLTFEETENYLLKELGQPAKSMSIACNKNIHYIDYFTDIKWDISIEKLDTSSPIDYLISKFLFKPKYNTLVPYLINLFQGVSMTHVNRDELRHFKSPKKFDNQFRDRMALLYNSIESLEITKFIYSPDSVSIAFTLQTNAITTTIFYHPQDNTLKFIDNHIIKEELFSYRIPNKFYILQNISHKTLALYNNQGIPYKIKGSEFIYESVSIYRHSFTFIGVRYRKNKIAVYNASIKPIILLANKFKVINVDFCLIEKDGVNYLAHYKKDELITGFINLTSYTHQNFGNNPITYFILESENNKFALCDLINFELLNPYDWDEYKIDTNFNYLFFKNEGKWYNLGLTYFKVREVVNPVFPKAINTNKLS